MSNYDLLAFAYDFSAEKHKNQRRKNSSKDPYINHPIRVAKILTDVGVDDVHVLCAAVLHDTIEDTMTTEEELVCNFGKKITEYIMQCTDDKKLSKLARKKMQVKHASGISTGAKYVKIADKISNLSDILTDPPKGWSDERRKGYAVWSYAVCRQMFGLNEKLDRVFMNVIEKFNLGDVLVDESSLNAELEKYYALMEKSE